MAGQAAPGVGSRRWSALAAARAILTAVVLVAGAVGGPIMSPGSGSRGRKRRPTTCRQAASLPGFREESTDLEGGLNDPSTALRRSFVAQDGSKRVIVSVAIGSSIANAHAILGARVNQLVRYQGWQIGPSDAIAETGYQGGGPGPDGNAAAMLAFRIFAVAAEVTVTSPSGEPDIPLLDNVARLVARRIRNEPDAVAVPPGFRWCLRGSPASSRWRSTLASGGVTVAVAPGTR